MKKVTLLLVAGISLVLSSQARVIAPAATDPSAQSERMAKISGMVQSFTADGSGLSYTELTKILKEVKGDNLTLKEKVGLKVFRKKLSNTFVEVSKGNTTGTGKAGGSKSQLVAALLCFFLGGLGIHRFYLGYIWQGIVQIITLGGFFGIWVLIDFIRILLGTLKPKDGEYDQTF